MRVPTQLASVRQYTFREPEPIPPSMPSMPSIDSSDCVRFSDAEHTGPVTWLPASEILRFPGPSFEFFFRDGGTLTLCLDAAEHCQFTAELCSTQRNFAPRGGTLSLRSGTLLRAAELCLVAAELCSARRNFVLTQRNFAPRGGTLSLRSGTLLRAAELCLYAAELCLYAAELCSAWRNFVSTQRNFVSTQRPGAPTNRHGTASDHAYRKQGFHEMSSFAAMETGHLMESCVLRSPCLGAAGVRAANEVGRRAFQSSS